MKKIILIRVILIFASVNTLLSQTYKRQVGKINYEVKDHLGDVAVVITDVKDYDAVTGKNTAHLICH